MSKIIATFSVIVFIFASLFNIVPWLHQSTEPHEKHGYTLAIAQNYSASTVYTDPLVVYLDNFLSAPEIAQLLNDSSSLFVPSQVFTQDTSSPQHRTSSSCSLSTDALLSSVISARALSFLDATSTKPSSLSYYGLEPLQLVQYSPSQYYHHHVDWFDTLIRDDLSGKRAGQKGHGRLYNRVASFFIYLEDDCLGGGTEFPDLKLEDSTIFAKSRRALDSQRVDSSSHDEGRNLSEELQYWEERIEIEEIGDNTLQPDKGTIFKPRKGSGVFWVNLHESGFGDPRVTHAGLPVREGKKVGMNIWVKRDFGW